MPNIHTKVRLRPIRYGFLLKPDDNSQAIKAFKINTCLWGGKFNPLIPVVQTVPPWWSRHAPETDSAADIVSGYLDYFEPDFLVEMEPNLAAGLGYNSERVIQADKILLAEGAGGRDGHGQDVIPLYHQLYEREYKFSRRKPHDIAVPSAADEALGPFVSCVFGSFPEDERLSQYAQDFTQAFDPYKLSVDATSFENLLREGLTSPLRLGHSEIEVKYHDLGTPVLFVLDATQPRDLIDFWNLRATRRYVVPIPKQFLPHLSDWSKEFIVENHQQLPGNAFGVMTMPTVMFSRSIATEELDALYKENFVVNVEGANCRQDWYPSIWRKPPGYVYRETRPTLSALEKTNEVKYDNEVHEISFESLSPSFAETYGPEARWANVVKYEDWSLQNIIATTFPTEYRDPKVPNFLIIQSPLVPTTEGLVYFPRWVNFQQRWALQSGSEIFREWFAANGVKATPSDAGRATEQIVQTLGGLAGVSCISDPKLIELFDKTSRTTSLSVHYKRFQNEINLAKRDSYFDGKGIFKNLVERRAVELGLEVRCAKCSSWTWYSLKEIDYKLACSLCRKQFDFPIADPGQSKSATWAYRPVGPFALREYAKGGYAAALALRFLTLIMGGTHKVATTWAAGHELVLSENEKVEADFLLWHQQTDWIKNDEPTDLIVGEAKSFGKDSFTQEDVERMKLIASRFPGTILVFATLRESSDISQKELGRLRELALWGRESTTLGRGSKAPLILLTGVELFSSFSVVRTWESIGGEHAKAVRSAMIHTENPREFADLTQQLYLGIEPYSTWLRHRLRPE